MIFLLLPLSAAGQKKNERIIEFVGDLQTGKSYFAAIEFNYDLKSWQTVKRLNLPFHHAGRVEWRNLKDFVSLQNPVAGERRRIAFRIVSKKVYRAAENRWNTIYQAKILYLIPDKSC